MRDTALDISAIIPVGQRYDDLARLTDEYAEVLHGLGQSFEIIVVLDGPHGSMAEDLMERAKSRAWLRIVELAREFGESAALSAGLAEALGRNILTLPGYHQVVPTELAKVVEAGNSADMVVAVRWPRSGSLTARLRRGGFHGFLKLLTGQRYRDLGCGMRLLKREIADEIPLYSDRHHFYPVLAWSRGFVVREVEVRQASGDTFRGPRSVRQYLHRMLDILTLFFLVRFTKKPLRFFGTIGFVVSALGAAFLAVLIIQRLVFGMALADRPALLLSSLMLVLGVQIFALGLIGELVIFTHARDLKEYAVRRVIGAGSPDAGMAGPRA
jgi:glycosyltransferase involved in cell wall biosynthesis